MPCFPRAKAEPKAATAGSTLASRQGHPPQLIFRCGVVEILTIGSPQTKISASLRNLYLGATGGGHLPDLGVSCFPRCEVYPFAVVRPTGCHIIHLPGVETTSGA